MFDNFLSIEKAEMADIQDNGWKPLRETRTDKERVLLAKMMFGNAVETDPNRNLSVHGFRSRNYRRKHLHLQPSSFEIQSGNLIPLPGFKQVTKCRMERVFQTPDDPRLSEEKISIKDENEIEHSGMEPTLWTQNSYTPTIKGKNLYSLK